jgi:Ca2+-binding RTX toxin-like protein
MEDTVNRKNFKDILASFGPDQPKTPALSREARWAGVAPRIVAEVLEARRMFDSATIVSGVLVVTGDSAADSIDVYESGGNVWVDFEGTPYNSFTPFDISAGYVKVDALAGNDTVKIGAWPTDYELRFPTLIYGGDGNDSIDASSSEYSDSIYGGVGYDTVHGDWGPDLIYGGTGTGDSSDSVTGYDLLYGGPDNDIMYGEGGFDTMYGDDGADFLKGGDGNDFIHGGNGADGMHGNAGDDTLHAGELSGSADILNGGSGTDCGYWDEIEDTDTDMEGNFGL